jgi:hypothetical protein
LQRRPARQTLPSLVNPIFFAGHYRKNGARRTAQLTSSGRTRDGGGSPMLLRIGQPGDHSSCFLPRPAHISRSFTKRRAASEASPALSSCMRRSGHVPLLRRPHPPSVASTLPRLPARAIWFFLRASVQELLWSPCRRVSPSERLVINAWPPLNMD